ncbi:hypothetical protein DLAC_07717 [Tieghemostelium lacteum]|uniref:PH domain-containing protein n=1 Tax=Tieghemostelium lacteum TaxID=361077 RepID=A0A151ZA71_TIELA|nr:hypothetical protein DLAC_07717 [Tieghemostelium lacteum]|eukprot:KYQ90846.1 hypothetical protein DLAC_07717 [Tieghemostelium lacteum]
MDYVIHSGYLQKWSSRELTDADKDTLEKSCSGTYHSSLPSNERVGSLKTRWFILQSDFLHYYDKPPKKILDYSCLKGQIYLRGCKIKHGGLITPIYQHWSIGVIPNTTPNKWRSIAENNHEQLAISLITPNGVEYTFTNASGLSPEDAIKTMENWGYSLSYAIFLANKIKEDPICGWLNKRGDKGHQFKNTKRRWFILQGNKLRYFTQPQKFNKITALKGIIDLTHLSEINDKMLTEVQGRNLVSGEDNSGVWNPVECFTGNHDLSISETSAIGTSKDTIIDVKTTIGLSLTIHNEKMYVLIFDSQEDREKWVHGIKASVERSYSTSSLMDAYKLVNQGERTVLVSGWMRKTKSNKWWERRFCTLTQSNIIYYKEDPPQTPQGSIFLLVSSCRVIKQKSLDGLDWCFSLSDSRGIEYFFNTETQDQMDRWIKAIKQARKKTLLALLDQGGKLVIPITIGKDCGLITIQVKETVRINSLSNKIAFEIAVINVKNINVINEKSLEISFAPVDGEVSEKKIEITSQNPHGILQLFKDLHTCLTD